MCQDKEGKIIGDDTRIKERCREYFQTLLNPQEQDPEEEMNNRQEQRTDTSYNGIEDKECITDISRTDEIKRNIQKLKNGKATGYDNIKAELIKYGGREVEELLQQLLARIWVEEEIPEDWRKSIICPIYKKGDKMNCNNYRGISLLCSAYKVFTSILKDGTRMELLAEQEGTRMELLAESILGEYQSGFRKGRSTTDQIFVMKQILEKCGEYEIETHQIYVDFQQAYDSIKREKLMEIFWLPAENSETSRNNNGKQEHL